MLARLFFAAVFIALLLPYSADDARAQKTIELIREQTLYVPAYSHIYYGDNEKPLQLTVTLSIRNIDRSHPIRLKTVEYYETQGALLKKLLEKPIVMQPMESKRFVIPERDRTGGSGANFIVEWAAEKPVNAPIVESIMIGTYSQQGISFTSRGQSIRPSE